MKEEREASSEALERRFHCELWYEICCQKTRVTGLPHGKNRITFRSLVLTQCQHVTNRQTDRQTHCPQLYCAYA